MTEAFSQHVVWASTKVHKILTVLAANNAELRDRLRWALEELAVIPRGGLPSAVISQLREIDEQTIEDITEADRRHTLGPLVGVVSRLSWKKKAIPSPTNYFCVLGAGIRGWMRSAEQ